MIQCNPQETMHQTIATTIVITRGIEKRNEKKSSNNRALVQEKSREEPYKLYAKRERRWNTELHNNRV